MKYIKDFETTSAYESWAASSGYVTPNVVLCEDTMNVQYNPFVHDYSQDYFTTVALESGTFAFNAEGCSGGDPIDLSYSLDNGVTWNQYTSSVSVNTNAKVMWKAANPSLNPSVVGRSFSGSGRHNIEGNVMSLLYGDNFQGQTSLSGKNNALFRLFYNDNNLVSAANLELPATTLARYCYSNMFDGCTSLTVAPQLPATTLAQDCYYSMFNSCTSLTEAPELPATTLAENCYGYMFAACTSLSAITCLATDISAHGCTSIWVSGVASNGTFTKAASMTSWTSGNHGIPTNWIVQDATS